MPEPGLPKSAGSGTADFKLWLNHGGFKDLVGYWHLPNA